MASASVEAPDENATNNINNIPDKKKVVALRLEHAEGKPLPKSPLLIYKSVHEIVGDIERGHTDNGGARYTLKVSDPEQVKLLLKMDKLNDGTPVIVTERPGNNITRCVIRHRRLIHFTEEELSEALASQGVIDFRKITRKAKDGSQEDTMTIVLSFSEESYPEYITLFNIRFKTSPYYPELIQCYKCWEFWHVKLECYGDLKCGTCSGAHETVKGQICKEKPYCNKCGLDDHPISSRKCPKYVAESTICRIRIDRNISYDDAKKAYWQEVIANYKEKKIAEYEKLMKKKDNTIGNLNDVLQKFAEFEEVIKKKDHEIQVLRAIFSTMNQVRKPASEERPAVQPKPQPKKKVPSKTVVDHQPSKAVDAKPKLKQNQAAKVEDQLGGLTLEDSQSAEKSEKPAGRSGKKKRGKGKK